MFLKEVHPGEDDNLGAAEDATKSALQPDGRGRYTKTVRETE